MLKPILFRLMVALLLVGIILPIFETGEAVADGAITHRATLTNGMTGLVAFANSGGKGFSIPQNILPWHNGVTDGDPISVTITDYGTLGLDFGTLNPGADKQPEAASPSITITADAGNTANVTVYLMGTDFTGEAGTFSVTNAFYNDADNPGTARAMSTSYGTSPWKEIKPGDNLTIYHWLTVLGGTPPGTYTSNFTYKTE